MTAKKAFIIFSLCIIHLTTFGQSKVEQWKRFEMTFNQTFSGNAFTDVQLQATFSSSDTTYIIKGFYDGNHTFKIRFMPPKLGVWNYTVQSNLEKLHNKKGSFECVKAISGNHGTVKVANTYDFRYADGKPYYPFGTTAYAWTHMSKAIQEETLNSLKKAGFNKIRMCVFPKNYDLVREEPELYPFEVKKIEKDTKGNEVRIWDFEKFNPAFFQHLEKRVADLDALGIEADLILFHPYDKGRWGFDAMPNEVNVRYLEYMLARLGSYKNVWWSLANEWDYLKSKTVKDWDLFAETMAQKDPYKHLCSIHGASSTYYNYFKPEFSHVSIQDEIPVGNPSAAGLLRNIYHKPIISDEVGYEGNLKSRWGRYSPEEMNHLVWNGVIAGTYVTHGECYMFKDKTDIIFWGKGGTFRGESWKRTPFIRKIVEECPNSLQLSDIGRDNVTATAGDGYYIIYFGKQMNDSWFFNLPAKNGSYKKLSAGKKFKVEIIDTWEMKIQEVPLVFETAKENDYRLFDKDLQKIRLPLKPYIALRITEIK
ncbi:DUF5060 domain-containing protein [Pedobacter sp. AW31-3R]|uniref:DUF5060 domain-containing protein n=1 Tax=Pedobacter sp. AW31-3R TaxID=3445781 RepID=UPI003F9F23F1